MLIVIAIVAVLISVAVPVLSSQLERSREAVDLANVRSAYAPGLHGGPAWKYPCHRHGQSEAEAGRVAVGGPREHRAASSIPKASVTRITGRVMPRRTDLQGHL